VREKNTEENRKAGSRVSVLEAPEAGVNDERYACLTRVTKAREQPSKQGEGASHKADEEGAKSK
jgi:hypothetical protein